MDNFRLDISDMSVSHFIKFLIKENLEFGKDCYFETRELENKKFSDSILGDFTEKEYKVTLVIKSWNKTVKFSL